MNRRGFTLLEMLLATALASVVILSALGMLGVIDRSEATLSARFDDMTQFTRCHSTLRRAMQSLVAAPPREARTSVSQVPGEETDAEQAQAEDEDATNEDGERPGRRSSRERDRQAARGEPHLTIGPLLVEDAGTSADVGDVPWRLEVVLTQPPFAGAAGAGAGPIRGAFDTVTDGYEWSLVWTPISPAGEPVVLAEHLALALVAVLPPEDSEYSGRYEAREQQDFPRAVRFILWTSTGTKTDWLFEPGVTLGETP